MMLYGCPTYEPESGFIVVHNNTMKPYYILLSCDDSLKLNHKLFPFIENRQKGIPSSEFSPNRIPPSMTGLFAVGGRKNMPELACESKKVTIFFLTDSVLLGCKWREIVEGQMYQEKDTYSKDQLDKMNWTIYIQNCNK